jgi:oligopeptide transport system substrate-binding protein
MKQAKGVKLKIRNGALFVTVLFVVFLSSCSEIQRPTAEPFYAESTPPAKQEFRWSNGKQAKSFDPARAAAAPETDIVRALFEGLTETDAKTLHAIPAAADKWSSTDEFRTWTFHIRRDAKWSNGQRLTAADFVSSWKRLSTLGDKAAHPDLFQNIVGLSGPRPAEAPTVHEPIDFIHSPAALLGKQLRNEQSNTASPVRPMVPPPVVQNSNSVTDQRSEGRGTAAVKPTPAKYGVEALDDSTLKVSLINPDKDLPKLVANPIFRPVYGDGRELEADPLDKGIVTNGAFTVAGVGKDGIILGRSQSYWNAGSVGLDAVHFVPKENAEAALDAYRRGDVDAVTNAEFEPLLLKLLAPYDDFRQTTHSALNFYEFNTANAPFSDHRVREALAIAIDRERLTNGELESSAQPASSFLPLGEGTDRKIPFDVERAKSLLNSAGYPDGENFPKIRLLVNRNDTQQRVARVIARMWKQNLNLETEINVKDLAELETVRASGQYDLMRRGVVLPTGDEAVSMSAIFGTAKTAEPLPGALRKDLEKTVDADGAISAADNGDVDDLAADEKLIVAEPADNYTAEETAVLEFNAIPLYFPMSYSLVKPYVKGFETNPLDAPMLRDISIDNNWQPRKGR